MKILKIIKNHSRNMDEDEIKTFLYKNLSREMIQGIEHDDPGTIDRVLRLLNIEFRVTAVDTPSDQSPPGKALAG